MKRSTRPSSRHLRRHAGLVVLLTLWSLPAADTAWARASRQSSSGALHGVTTTQQGAVPLAGVTVTAARDGDDAATRRSSTSDTSGRYAIGGLPPGTYTVTASLSGFRDLVRQDIVIAAGEDRQLDLDVPLAVSTSTTARPDPNAAPATGASTESLQGRMIDVLPVKGDDFMSLLPLVPGVLRGADGRLSVKGGRPAQTGLQLGQAAVADPTVGSGGFELPIDAVDRVDVLPNPYVAEYGRFSSGLVKIDTSRGPDRWQFTANSVIPMPCLKVCDGVNLGIRSYDPRLIVGGPIVPGRLFISESVQGHYNRDRVLNVSSSAGGDTSRTALFTFTRVDLRAGRHAITATHDLFPSTARFVNLNTFNPQAVTADVHQRGYDLAVSDSWRLSPVTLVEQTVNIKRHRISVDGQAPAGEFTMTPDGNTGNFFNRQERRSITAQWVGSMSLVRHTQVGDHIVKLGADILHATFDGVSDSSPVEVRRTDGSLAERVEFGAPAAQRLAATDASAFAQDAWRMTDRALVESGVRVDRDGVTGALRATPRVGFVAGLLPAGRGILRGGAGWYADRTPLLAGTFEMLETRQVTRFDGTGDVESSTAYVNRIMPGLQPPLSRVWNLEYDQRVGSASLLKVNHLERDGRHELIVDPVTGEAAGELRLASAGTSRYRETEVTMKYVRDDDRQVAVTYVYSHSDADFNAFDLFFGNLRAPIIRQNAYGRTGVDVPHRVIARSRWPALGWSVVPLIEIRSGLPYSVLDEGQQFVGERNSARFPTFLSLDLNISRVVMMKGRHVRLGLRINHLLNNWTPRDVQSNIDSSMFGTYYNTLPWRFGLTFEIQR